MNPSVDPEKKDPAQEALPTSPHAIEQYKAKLVDLGNLGTRQTAMTSYYVSIVSALLGVLALKEKNLAQMDTSVLLIVCGAGILICTLWFTSLTFFRGLFRAKIRVLEEIELVLPFQTFEKEFQIMQRSRISSWVRIERIVPLVFSAFFISIAAIRIWKLLACASQ